MADHVFKKSRGYPDRRLMHPQREWFIGIVLFMIVVALGSLFAGDVFVKYRNISVEDGDSGESIPRYRDAIIQNALESYQARTETYDTLRNAVVAQPVVSTSTEESSVEQGEDVLTEGEVLEAF